MTGRGEGPASEAASGRGGPQETLRYAAAACLALFGASAAAPALWALARPGAPAAHGIDLVMKAANPLELGLWCAAALLCAVSGLQLGSRRPELAADTYLAALAVGASTLFALSRSLPVRMLAPPATPALLCVLGALAGLGLFAVLNLAPRPGGRAEGPRGFDVRPASGP